MPQDRPMQIPPLDGNADRMAEGRDIDRGWTERGGELGQSVRRVPMYTTTVAAPAGARVNSKDPALTTEYIQLLLIGPRP